MLLLITQFPPLTALEVSETRVEGAILIVQLRPSMKSPGSLKTGTKDLEAAAKERKERELEMQKVKAEAEAERKRAAAAMALKQRQVHWQQSMADMRLAASRRQAATMQAKMAKQQKEALASKLKLAVDHEQKQTLLDQLQLIEKDLVDAQNAAEAAEEKAAKAKEGETKALQAKIDAEHKVGVNNWKMAAMYGEKQFMKGLMRAREAMKLRGEIQGGEVAPPPAEAPSPPPPPEPAVAKIDHGPLGDITVEETVHKFASVVGTQEDWAKNEIHEEDVEFLHKCLDKIIKLCESSKKNRKAASGAGFFERISEMMWRYEGHPSLLLHCTQAIAAVTKKAEADKIQDASQGCMFKLVETMDVLQAPAIEAFKKITCNHRDNTQKLVRAGGLVAWLDTTSNVVPPDQSGDEVVRLLEKKASMKSM